MSIKAYLCQVIAFLAYLAERGERGPWLIVAPASLLPNWEAELAAWAPHLALVAYKGSAQAREEIFASQVCFPAHVRRSHLYSAQLACA